MTYEQFVADVQRLIRAPKELDEFERLEVLPRLFRIGYDPAGAVVFVQDLRDGGDGIDDSAED